MFKIGDILISVTKNTNLCDLCLHSQPTCKSSVIKFGDGIGKDNILKCSGFDRKPYQPPKCNSCTRGYTGKNGNGYQPCTCR